MRFGDRHYPEQSACQRPKLTRHHAVVASALALAGCGHFQQPAENAKMPTLRVADAALATGAPEVALNVAQVLLEKDPHNVKALIARGDAYYAMRRREEAEASYRAAAEVDPAAAGAQVGLGRILARRDPAAAEAAFLTALKSDPVNADALNNLGVVRDLSGRYSEAEDAYYHALMVAPDSVEVQINLGVSLALSGHTETALRVLRGVASDPDAAQAFHDELSHALTIAGDPAMGQQLAQAEPAPTPADPAPAAPATTVATAAPKPQVAPAPAPTATASAAPENNVYLPPDALHPAPRIAVAKAELPAVMAAAPPAIVTPVAGTVAPAPARTATASAAPDNSVNLSPDTLHPAPRIAVAKPELPAVMAAAPAAIVMPVASTAEPAPVRPRPTPAVKLAKAVATDDVKVDAKANGAIATGPSDGEAFVQLGSLNSEADARLEWERLTKLSAGSLAGHDPIVTPADVHGRTYWRLRTFGFASANAATDICNELKKLAQRCWSGRGL